MSVFNDRSTLVLGSTGHEQNHFPVYHMGLELGTTYAGVSGGVSSLSSLQELAALGDGRQLLFDAFGIVLVRF